MSESLLKYCCKNPSTEKILIIFGAVGWLSSMIAQLFAISSNKSITPEKKKFLIPQETADGLSNTALYVCFTSAFAALAKKLVDRGKLTTPDIQIAIAKIADKYNTTGEEIKKILDNLTGMKERRSLVRALKNEHPDDLKVILDSVDNYSLDSSKPLAQNVENAIKKIAAKASKQVDEVIHNITTANKRMNVLDLLNGNEYGTNFFKIRSGVGILATLLAAVISVNVFTPIVRNKIGVAFQNRAEAETFKKNPYPTIMKTTKYTAPVKTYSTFSNITNI